MAELEIGGQVATRREFESNEQRTRRLYREKFEAALKNDIYSLMSSQIPSILDETLGPAKTPDVDVGIPDIVHYDAPTMAGAYYILFLLDIGYPTREDLSEYIQEATGRMIDRKIHPDDRTIILTTQIIEKIIDTLKYNRSKNSPVAHQVDMFQYALMVVYYRARSF
jgi:hypothetical protein